MQWTDQAIVLASRKHGETSAILEVLTRDHGRSLGLVRSGRSRRMRPVLQTGNLVEVTWRARLEDHLGQFSVEALELRAAGLIDDPFRLAGLTTLAGWARVLPEREPHQRLYDALQNVQNALAENDIWPALLVRWELGLLDELGFGLDLSTCAATGSRDDLIYVSPRTGRAVSRLAGEPYKAKLLKLPGFLLGSQGGSAGPPDIIQAFKLTGHFLHRHVTEPRGLPEPVSRSAILRRLERETK